MSLFEDDFFSTKVSRQGRSVRRARVQGISWPRKSKRGLSTMQISIISSVISSVLAVLIFSLITGLPSSSPQASAVGGTSVTSGDPFERIIQSAAIVRPAVVSIVNYKDAHEDEIDLELSESALGSGVIFKKEDGKAYVITNNHVIDGGEELEVITVTGEMLKATLVGTDTINDVAVLSIDGSKITTIAEMGDSSKLRLGETVIAIGNPLGLGDTLTSGIVSYANRVIPVSLNQDGVYDWEQEVIQTDAAINEGNSGGALIDLNGRVIGINTMKISDMGVEGLGFAIPVNEVMETVNELMTKGKVSRPYLGVYTIDLNNRYAPLDEEQREELNLPSTVEKGVLVLDAVGPAKEAGLQLNDVIIKFNGKPIGSTMELRKFLYDQTKIGEELVVTFYREGKLMTKNVLLTEKPDEQE